MLVTIGLQNASDAQLARQSQEGSLVAFEELVRRYERRIYGFAVRFCGNATDAGELTQDTFVKAYQGIARFDSRRSFACWLFTIARRTGIDRHRANRRTECEPSESVDYRDPATLLVHQEEEAGVWQLASRHLPEDQAQALWLRYVQDLNVVEIAQVLNKTRTHVKVLLFRARKTLARHLRPETGSGPAPAPPPALALAIHSPKQPL